MKKFDPTLPIMHAYMTAKQITQNEMVALYYMTLEVWRKEKNDRSAISGLVGRGVKTQKVFRKTVNGECHALRYARFVGGKFTKYWYPLRVENVEVKAYSNKDGRFYWALRRTTSASYPVRILDEEYSVSNSGNG